MIDLPSRRDQTETTGTERGTAIAIETEIGTVIAIATVTAMPTGIENDEGPAHHIIAPATQDAIKILTPAHAITGSESVRKDTAGAEIGILVVMIETGIEDMDRIDGETMIASEALGGRGTLAATAITARMSEQITMNGPVSSVGRKTSRHLQRSANPRPTSQMWPPSPNENDD